MSTLHRNQTFQRTSLKTRYTEVSDVEGQFIQFLLTNKWRTLNNVFLLEPGYVSIFANQAATCLRASHTVEEIQIKYNTLDLYVVAIAIYYRNLF